VSNPRKNYASTGKRWQRKRRRIIARANGLCEWCSEPTKSFNVHHLTYIRGKDERDEDLVALCFDCHQSAHPGRRLRLPTKRETRSSGRGTSWSSSSAKASKALKRAEQEILDRYSRKKNVFGC
jgi:5-methylcytosine-specific restriction endonuclease McrA